MDGLGECGCSGTVGNHLQIAIHPYCGFAIIPWFSQECGLIPTYSQCQYQLYTHRQIVITEERDYRGQWTSTHVLTLLQTINVFNGAATEEIVSQSGEYHDEPIYNGTWLPESRTVTAANETTQTTVVVNGFGSEISGYRRTQTIEQTLSVPNALSDWAARCSKLVWYPSIANIRRKISENPDYSLTLWAYNANGTIGSVDARGFDGVWKTGELSLAGVRYFKFGADGEPFPAWMSRATEMLSWMWDGYTPVWSVMRGYIYNRFPMNHVPQSYRYTDDKFQPYELPPGITFQTSVRLCMLPNTNLPPGSDPINQNHYEFRQSILFGQCDNDTTDSGNAFYLTEDTEMVMDLNSDTDPGRAIRGSQSVALYNGVL